jgi:hypothetical protein
MYSARQVITHIVILVPRVFLELNGGHLITRILVPRVILELNGIL